MSEAVTDLVTADKEEQSALSLPATSAQSDELSDWIALLKPRVMTLVVFTGLIGLLIAPGHLHPVLAFTAVLCIAVAAGACGAINMWYDRDIDAVMRRTRNRPIPAGRVEPGAALGYGVIAIGKQFDAIGHRYTKIMMLDDITGVRRRKMPKTGKTPATDAHLAARINA